MRKKFIYLMSFVLVLGLLSSALADGPYGPYTSAWYASDIPGVNVRAITSDRYIDNGQGYTQDGDSVIDQNHFTGTGLTATHATGWDGAWLTHDFWKDYSGGGEPENRPIYTPGPQQYNAGTAVGGAYIAFEFSIAVEVDQMGIWNHSADASETYLGIQDCIIQYSLTGGTSTSDWTTHATGTIAEASGVENDVDTILDFQTTLKYIVITPATTDGTWSGGASGVNDHVNFGLGEVVFTAFTGASEQPVITPPINLEAYIGLEYSETPSVQANARPITYWTKIDPCVAEEPNNFVFDANTGNITWTPEEGSTDLTVKMTASNLIGGTDPCTSDPCEWVITVLEPTSLYGPYTSAWYPSDIPDVNVRCIVHDRYVDNGQGWAAEPDRLVDKSGMDGNDFTSLHEGYLAVGGDSCENSACVRLQQK